MKLVLDFLFALFLYAIYANTIRNDDWTYYAFAFRCWFIKAPGYKCAFISPWIRSFRFPSYISPLSSFRMYMRLTNYAYASLF